MANVFADTLSDLLAADGRTVARILRESGDAIPLPTLLAYKHGTRLPQTMERVNQIGDALKLSKSGAALLRRKYIVAVDERAKAKAGVAS